MAFKIINSRKSTVIIILATFVLSILLILWITSRGPGVSPDSTDYLRVSENLRSGHGYTFDEKPSSFYPPLFPLVLAGIGLVVKNVLSGARLLNAVLFGIDVGLVGLLVYLAAGRSVVSVILSMVFCLFSAPFLGIYAMVYSEPVFITLSLLAVLCLVRYKARPTGALLVSSAVLVGLAGLSRYIGIAFIPAGLLLISWGSLHLAAPRKVLYPLSWLILASAPLGVFVAWNWIQPGASSPRMLVYHPISFRAFLSKIIATSNYFLAPSSPGTGIRTAFMVIIIILVSWLIVRSIRRREFRVDWTSTSIVTTITCFLFSISYAIFLYLAITFFDAATPVDMRLLSPIFMILTVGAFSFAWSLFQSSKRIEIWLGFLVLAAILTVVKIPDAVHSAAGIHANGLGYTSQAWKSSETIAYLNSTPLDQKIFSNGSDALGFLTHTQAVGLPMKIFAITRQINPDYASEIAALCTDLRQGKALVVYFSNIDRFFFPTQAELLYACPIPVLKEFNDGVLFGVEQP